MEGEWIVMALKAFILSTKEVQETVYESLVKEGQEVQNVQITVNEESGEDIALVTLLNETREIPIVSFFDKVNEKFDVNIQEYDGYHYTEFKENTEGFVFFID